MRFLFILCFMLCIQGVKAQDVNCAKFRNGSFTYPDNKNKLSVREGSEQKSYSNGQLDMLWDVEWTSECEYVLTCKKMYAKGYPFRKGDKIYAKIIDTDEECFTAETIFFNKDFPNGSHVITSTMCIQE